MAAIALVAAWLGGAWLRLWHLGAQLVMGDEVRTLAAAVERSWLDILSDHGKPDVCAPLAFWSELCIKTVGLDEWTFRLPVLAQGLLFLPLISLFAWRHVGRLEAVLVAWLAATSPLLLLYSRFTRPYGLVAFLVLLSALTWFRWIATGRPRWGALSVTAATVAIFSTVTCSPTILALATFGLVQAARHERRQPDGSSTRRLPTSAALVATGIAATVLLHLPGQESLRALFGTEAAPIDTDFGALNPRILGHILAGTESPAALIAFGAAAVVGVFGVGRRHPAFATLALLLVVVQATTVVFVVEWSYKEPVVARFLAGAFPGLLLFVAGGIATVVRGVAAPFRRRPSLRHAVTAAIATAVVAALVVDGPLHRVYRWPNAFTNRVDSTSANQEVDIDQPLPWPPFYDALGRHPGAWVVAESPQVYGWGHAPFAMYQDRHRQRVVMLTPSEFFRTTGVHFRTVVPYVGGRPEWTGIDYVVIHRNPLAERWRILESLPSPLRPPLILHDKKMRKYGARGARAVDHYGVDERLTEIYADEEIVAYACNARAAESFRRWERAGEP